MVKHNETICRQFVDELFDDFVKLALKVLRMKMMIAVYKIIGYRS